MAKEQRQAVEGFFDPSIPALTGTTCVSCGTIFFPAETTSCRNPRCFSTEFTPTNLSTRGTIWSYTDAQYQPPPPYVPADPYTPFALAAVELEAEGLVVMGQLANGIGVDDLEVGMEVELISEVLYSDDEADYLVWKWHPVSGASNGE